MSEDCRPAQRTRERDGKERLELRGNVEIHWANGLQIGSAPGPGPTEESMVWERGGEVGLGIRATRKACWSDFPRSSISFLLLLIQLLISWANYFIFFSKSSNSDKINTIILKS